MIYVEDLPSHVDLVNLPKNQLGSQYVQTITSMASIKNNRWSDLEAVYFTKNQNKYYLLIQNHKTNEKSIKP